MPSVTGVMFLLVLAASGELKNPNPFPHPKLSSSMKLEKMEQKGYRRNKGGLTLVKRRFKVYSPTSSGFTLVVCSRGAVPAVPPWLPSGTAWPKEQSSSRALWDNLGWGNPACRNPQKSEVTRREILQASFPLCHFSWQPLRAEFSAGTE